MILRGPGAFDLLIGRRRGDGDLRRVAVSVMGRPLPVLEADLSTISATIDDLLAGPDPATAVRVVTALIGWAYDRNRLQLAWRWLTTATGRPDLDR